MEKAQDEIWVLLHNIRSAHNVGSMFRTGDAIGVTRFLLSGFTPTPLDRFKRPVKEIAKTALGAELSIPWEQGDSALDFVAQAKASGFTVVGVEQDVRAVDYKTYVPKAKTLIVMGEEVNGIEEALRNVCDVFIELPMKGDKESLNVSVAFGITMYRLFDR
ncbi:MAG TPA: TrmH family RNA methyltransferase [Candidatus Paceibacterota bacterium]|nr:TrmH family RNA methyltransferase [Candidatus Paceibacterota bacterium]